MASKAKKVVRTVLVRDIRAGDEVRVGGKWYVVLTAHPADEHGRVWLALKGNTVIQRGDTPREVR